MLNRDRVARAKRRLTNAIQENQEANQAAVAACTALHQMRAGKAHKAVCDVEAYMDTMAKVPLKLRKAIKEYKQKYEDFSSVAEAFESSTMAASLKSTAVAGGGVAVGAATAFMGPSAAMAVATTFGTASTGTAISTLSGAAATKAALAWLGGGAIAAGGGGMAGGSALMALAGPVGAALAGASLLGGALYMRSANAKAADKAIDDCIKIEKNTLSVTATTTKVQALHDLTKKTAAGLQRQLKKARDEMQITSAVGASDEEVDLLAAMANNVTALGELLEQNVLMEPS